MVLWIRSNYCGGGWIPEGGRFFGLCMGAQHREKFCYLLIYSDNPNDESKEWLRDSTCWPYVTPKVAGRSFTSLCSQVDERTSVVWCFELILLKATLVCSPMMEAFGCVWKRKTWRNEQLGENGSGEATSRGSNKKDGRSRLHRWPEQRQTTQKTSRLL